MGSVKLKHLDRRQLKGRFMIGLAMLLTGFAAMIVSGVLGVVSNTDRYGRDADPVEVAVRITGCEQVFSESEQDGGFVAQGKWRLLGEYQLDGEKHFVMLDEGYTDESFAVQEMGMTRGMVIDRNTGAELHERPLSWLFLLAGVPGMICSVCGGLYLFRYSDYRARLKPAGRQAAFVIRRGSGL